MLKFVYCTSIKYFFQKCEHTERRLKNSAHPAKKKKTPTCTNNTRTRTQLTDSV